MPSRVDSNATQRNVPQSVGMTTSAIRFTSCSSRLAFWFVYIPCSIASRHPIPPFHFSAAFCEPTVLTAEATRSTMVLFSFLSSGPLPEPLLLPPAVQSGRYCEVRIAALSRDNREGQEADPGQ